MKNKTALFLFSVLLSVSPLLSRQAADAPAVGTSELLTRTRTALQQAEEDGIDVLAPRDFTHAQDAYEEALSLISRSKSEDLIARRLREALESLLAAEETARTAQLTVPNLIESRQAAVSAGADTLAGDSWERAEFRFEAAIRDIEREKTESAREEADEISGMFRVARRDALRNRVLGETRQLIEAAERRKGERLVPTLLLRAQQAVSRAEAALAEEDFETAQQEAEAATAEARHALAFIDQIERAQSRKEQWEAAMLPYDDLLTAVADSLGGRLNFSRGGWYTGRQLLNLIEKRLDSLAEANEMLHSDLARMRTSLEASLTEALTDLADAQNRIAELEKRIGVVEDERSAARDALERQAQIAERIKRAQDMFKPGDAVVLPDEEGHVILRLHGIKFGIGKTSVSRSQHAIINTAAEAIDLFPGAAITVEGHTDSQGGEKVNQEISERRARSVADYLRSKLGVAEERIQVKGCGESQPVADNSVASGRALNRRIDIVLTVP